MTGDAQSSIGYIREEIPRFDVPAYEGDRYEALAPDTLDLQERAALAINVLTGATDPNADYEVYWSVSFRTNPPTMKHDWSDAVQCKFHDSLPLMRIASGSDLNSHVDRRWMEVLLHMQGPDGLLYHPTRGRPWARIGDTWGSADAPQFATPTYCGRILGALILYAIRDRGGIWEEATKRLVDGLAVRVVERGDYAYFPKGALVEHPAQPPDTQMPVGVVASAQSGWVVQGLAEAYRFLGYEPALELAGKLSRYLKDHSKYYDTDGAFLPDGVFWPDTPATGATEMANYHHHLYPLLGLVEYGMVSGDQEILEFGHNGFQYGIANGEPLTGFFPEYLKTSKLEESESCAVADMLALALKLTEAGAGDYWDDVDRWTRNMFAEGQLTQCDWIERLPHTAAAGDDEPHRTSDRVVERNMGAFGGWQTANDWGVGGIMHCCTGNAARAIYYIWENILHYQDGNLRVNLLLNRASQWADVESHIPYVGQVDVKVKQPVALSIRIPEWVKPAETRVQVNGVDRRVSWAGRYAEVGQVKPQDTASVTFPIAERTDTVYVEKERYTLVRKGNDVVAIDPPGRYNPLYQRAHYRQNSTRWRKIERFASKEDIYW